MRFKGLDPPAKPTIINSLMSSKLKARLAKNAKYQELKSKMQQLQQSGKSTVRNTNRLSEMTQDLKH